MAAHQIRCKHCNKIAIEEHRIKFGKEFMLTLKCGHKLITRSIDILSEDTLDNYSSVKGDKLMPFQKETVNFIFNSGGRTGVFHAQGLGKTVCGLAALALKPEMLPALVICKSNLARQWFKQGFNWAGEKHISQIIETSQDFLLPGLPMYVVSYDLLGRDINPNNKGKKKHHKKEDAIPFSSKLKELGLKTIIVDECQNIKNSDSKRAKEVMDLCNTVPYVMLMSGTPIKNNAAEYFVALNILAPSKFPTKAYFERNFIDSYWDGHRYKVGGLQNADYFHQITKDFIIRKEMSEVMKDMPAFRRNPQYFDIDTELRKQYTKAEDELLEYTEDNVGENGPSFGDYQHILAILTRMRQITGVAKVEAVCDDIEEFLTNTDKKIVIFVHHHLVRDLINAKLKELILQDEIKSSNPILLTSEMNPDERESAKMKFIEDVNARILIASTLSSGEGLDGLQLVCSDMIVVERQWNPANEEQVEKRLHRYGQLNPVMCNYPLAVGTVDEFFTELVEQKRAIVGKTMGDNAVVEWNESNIIKDLVSAIQSKRGGKKWKMPSVV